MRVKKRRAFKSFPKLREAREWAAREERELRLRELPAEGQAPRRTAGEMIDAYVRNVLEHKTDSVDFKRAQRTQFAWWKAKIGATPLSEVTPAVVSAMQYELRAGGRGNSTVNRYLSALSHCFTVAVKQWRWAESNPVSAVLRFPEPPGRVATMEAGEAGALLEAAREEEAKSYKPMELIVGLAACAGMRKTELRFIERRNVSFDKNGARIVLEKTKTKKRRSARVEAPAILRALRLRHAETKGRKYLFCCRSIDYPFEFDREWRRVRTRAKAEDLRFHDLRHVCASAMALTGSQTHDIKEQLGHASIQQTQRYTHLIPSHADAAALLLAIILAKSMFAYLYILFRSELFR